MDKIIPREDKYSHSYPQFVDNYAVREKLSTTFAKTIYQKLAIDCNGFFQLIHKSDFSHRLSCTGVWIVNKMLKKLSNSVDFSNITSEVIHKSFARIVS